MQQLSVAAGFFSSSSSVAGLEASFLIGETRARFLGVDDDEHFLRLFLGRTSAGTVEVSSAFRNPAWEMNARLLVVREGLGGVVRLKGRDATAATSPTGRKADPPTGSDACESVRSGADVDVMMVSGNKEITSDSCLDLVVRSCNGVCNPTTDVAFPFLTSEFTPWGTSFCSI